MSSADARRIVLAALRVGQAVTHEFRRTGQLFRLALRRDRWVMPWWVFALGAITAVYYQQFEKLYPTEAGRQTLVVAAKANPAWVALSGPLLSNSVGALALWKSSITVVVLALAVSLTVVRHGRADEEFGRRELLESTPIGRLAHPAAAVLLGVVAATATGVIDAAMLSAVGAPIGGSLLAGAALALVGIVFALLAALAGELTQSARTARVIAGGVLALSFLLRAAGDVGEASGRGWLSWLSPLGWANAVQAFGANRWWVLLLPIALIAVATPVVFVIDRRRDIGSGVLQARLGRPTAKRSLRSPFALSWRLQRTTLFAWALGFMLMGYVLGSSIKSLADTLNSSPQLIEWLQRLGGVGAVTDLYNAVVINVAGIIAAGYAISATLRLHSEEDSGHAEMLLSNAVSRMRWAWSHLIVALLGSAVLMLVVGVTAGLSQDAAMGTGTKALNSLVQASLVQLPAVWLLAAITVLLIGVAPKWAMLSWAVYAVMFLCGVIIPAAWPNSHIADLSPFTHIPRLPGSAMTWQPVLWLSALTVVGLAAGLFGLRRRDMR